MNGSKIDEVRALFGHFVRSDCVSLHVRTAGIELFVARTPGEVNPMMPLATPPAGDRTEAGSAPMPPELSITAPHLGTLTDLARLGAPIAVGDRIATLELLGDPIAIVADRAGTVHRHIGQIGALVEFDQALLTLA